MDPKYFVLFLILGGAAFLIARIFRKKKWNVPAGTMPDESKKILEDKVNFYASLSEDEKPIFEFKVREFLVNCRITGIKTDVTLEDKLLIASSAVIPVFRFRDWKYVNLFEVLLYPEEFDANFQTEGEGRHILGMVGNGYMEGKMILSKEALHHGFSNDTDKRNTAVHEFVHLIDKMDGTIDGVPSLLMKEPTAIPWMHMINEGIEQIQNEESDIDSYGATNEAEFFAVASEYFFERPKLLSRKHPELYAALEKVFRQDMDERELRREKLEIGRNDPCPCGSGKKFKKCCGSVHY